MFTAKIGISTTELRELLIKEGYLHKSFSNSKLINIERKYVTAQELHLYDSLTLEFETESIDREELYNEIRS